MAKLSIEYSMQNESFIGSLILKWVLGENHFLFKTIKFSVESWKSEVLANFIVAICKSLHSNGAEHTHSHTLQRPVNFNVNKLHRITEYYSSFEYKPKSQTKLLYPVKNLKQIHHLLCLTFFFFVYIRDRREYTFSN